MPEQFGEPQVETGERHVDAADAAIHGDRRLDRLAEGRVAGDDQRRVVARAGVARDREEDAALRVAEIAAVRAQLDRVDVRRARHAPGDVGLSGRGRAGVRQRRRSAPGRRPVRRRGRSGVRRWRHEAIVGDDGGAGRPRIDGDRGAVLDLGRRERGELRREPGRPERRGRDEQHRGCPDDEHEQVKSWSHQGRGGPAPTVSIARCRGGERRAATIIGPMAADPAFAPVPAEPDHVGLEHAVLERWEREGTFEQLREKNAGGPTFSFTDGPITANNPMGIHHAWGRSLKDLFQRYHAALGEDQRYQNGFDCQGLWVEVEVEKSLGLNSKHEIEAYGLDRFARACRDRVAEYSSVQTEQSKRLGMWMDWERSYFTMTDPNISYIWGFLKVCHDRGWLYQGHRPMVWCLRCGTSLSQHEVTATDSYRDIVDPSLYVRFRFTDAPGRGARDLDDHALDAACERRGDGEARRRVRLGRARRRAPRRREGALRGRLRRGRERRRERARVGARRASLCDGLRRPRCPGRDRPSCRGRRRHRARRGHGDRPHRARLRRRGLRDRPAGGASRARTGRRGRASSSRATASSSGTARTRCPTSSSPTSSAAAGCSGRSPTSTATRTAGAAARS